MKNLNEFLMSHDIHIGQTKCHRKHQAEDTYLIFNQRGHVVIIRKDYQYFNSV